jgi:CheY-like chemotaxis protein
MAKSGGRRTILMADDDAEDCILVRDALHEIGRNCELRFVRDGQELLDYLRHEGEYSDDRNAPWPDLILLDLKMPRKDGRETIRELKGDARHRSIPIVALTTSSASDDVEYCYDAGVNTYLAKPGTFHELTALLDALCRYWFDSAELPSRAHYSSDAAK